jgi:hypothetical protein
MTDGGAVAAAVGGVRRCSPRDILLTSPAIRDAIVSLRPMRAVVAAPRIDYALRFAVLRQHPFATEQWLRSRSRRFGDAAAERWVEARDTLGMRNDGELHVFCSDGDLYSLSLAALASTTDEVRTELAAYGDRLWAAAEQHERDAATVVWEAVQYAHDHAASLDELDELLSCGDDDGAVVDDDANRDNPLLRSLTLQRVLDEYAHRAAPHECDQRTERCRRIATADRNVIARHDCAHEGTWGGDEMARAYSFVDEATRSRSICSCGSDTVHSYCVPWRVAAERLLTTPMPSTERLRAAVGLPADDDSDADDGIGLAFGYPQRRPCDVGVDGGYRTMVDAVDDHQDDTSDGRTSVTLFVCVDVHDARRCREHLVATHVLLPQAPSEAFETSVLAAIDDHERYCNADDGCRCDGAKLDGAYAKRTERHRTVRRACLQRLMHAFNRSAPSTTAPLSYVSSSMLPRFHRFLAVVAPQHEPMRVVTLAADSPADDDIEAYDEAETYAALGVRMRAWREESNRRCAQLAAERATAAVMRAAREWLDAAAAGDEPGAHEGSINDDGEFVMPPKYIRAGDLASPSSLSSSSSAVMHALPQRLMKTAARTEAHTPQGRAAVARREKRRSNIVLF